MCPAPQLVLIWFDKNQIGSNNAATRQQRFDDVRSVSTQRIAMAYTSLRKKSHDKNIYIYRVAQKSGTFHFHSLYIIVTSHTYAKLM